MTKKISILGAGMMSSALAFPASENGNNVHIIGTNLDDKIIDKYLTTGRHDKFCKPFPDNVSFHYFSEWKDVVKGSDFIVAGISSFGVEWFLNEVLLQLPEEIPVLCLTKGLEAKDNGDLISYPEYWEKALEKAGKHIEICAIGGPCISHELVFTDHTAVGLCGRSSKVLRMMKEALQCSYYHISITNDVRGLETAVAIKNAYAMAVTLAIGINARKYGEENAEHYNSQAVLFAQAAKEMHYLIQAAGGSPDSEYIGIGDLYVTCLSGRTRQFGILVGKGLDATQATEALSGITLESVSIIKTLAKSLKIKDKEGKIDLNRLPLLMHVVDIIENGKNGEDLPWDKFSYEDLNQS